MPTGKTFTNAEKIEVESHLAEVLHHPSFSKSERSSKLLRFLVEAVLSDSTDSSLLKERTLGHDVFGRAPDYDSNDDPVVRNAASEIRKRLAQYYQDSKTGKTVKITLTPGSYRPEFEFFGHIHANSRESVPLPPVPETVLAFPASAAVRPYRGLVNPGGLRTKVLWSAVCAAIIAITAIIASQVLHRSAADRFWGQVFSTKQEIIICAGPSGERLRNSTDGLSRPEDTSAVTMIASFLKAHQIPTNIVLARETSLDTMKGRPVVLVGALNNQWTTRLLNGLRYRFVHDTDVNKIWISDSLKPEVHPWELDWVRDLGETTVDYAIVTRVKNPTTGGMIVSVGGLGLNGTEAAAQFVTDENGLQALDKITNRTNSNLQVVLKTSVHKGVTGSPEIVAAYSW